MGAGRWKGVRSSAERQWLLGARLRDACGPERGSVGEGL